MSPRNAVGVIVAAVALVLASVPAAAQSPQTPQRGYVVGLGGLGATQVNSALFGASAGFNVTPDLQITVDAGRMQDVQATFTHDDLALLDQQITSVMNSINGPSPFASTVKMPTNYVTGGVRYLVPVRGGVRPYVSGSAGIAHMSPETNFALGGIQLQSFLTQLGQTYPELLPDIQRLTSEMNTAVGTTFREDTRPMASVGGGVSVTVVRHLAFDFGYRYSAIFIQRDYLQGPSDFSPHTHNRIDVHRVYAGVGVTF